jgi:hypothetical protein
MLITAHQGASPEAPLGEVPKDIAAASVAMPNVNLDTVFVTTVPHWFPVVLKHRKGKTDPLSEGRPSFFNVRYSAARPMIALFFFESETAGLMFVRHRWPQGFRW